MKQSDWFLFKIIILRAAIKYGESFVFNLTEYHVMPKLYLYDDYDTCMEGGPKSLYCVVDTFIEPNLSSFTWQTIVKYNNTKRHFRHDHIQRGLCFQKCNNTLSKFDKFYLNDKLYVGKPHFNNLNILDPGIFKNGLHDNFDQHFWTSYCINEELQSGGFNVQGRSNVDYCLRNNDHYQHDFLDYLFYTLLVLHVFLTIFATFYDYRANFSILSTNPSETTNLSARGLPILLAFSVFKNWQKLFEPPVKNSNLDLQYLHAIRFLTMYGVVGGHTLIFYNIFPSINPEYMEKNFYRIVTMLLIHGFKIIETYFVLSGFLLSVNFMVFIENGKKFNIRIFWNALLYRYFRFIPMLIFVMLFYMTTLTRLQDGPVWKFFETDRTFCRNYWWTNLLMINNYVHLDTPCIQQSWFLAADFQLTIVGILIMMTIWKHPKLLQTIFVIGFSFAYLIPTIVVYTNKFEGTMIVSPESLKYIMWFDEMYKKFYTVTYTNIGNYLCGILAGIIIHKLKGSDIALKNYKSFVILWYLTVPIGVGILLSGYIFYDNDFEKPSIWISIYASVTKNVWGLLSILFIVGFHVGLGSNIKSFLSYSLFRVLGKITFCVFLTHTTVLRLTLGNLRGPLYLSDMTLLVSVSSTFFLSYLLGLILHVIIESPFLAILKYVYTKRLIQAKTAKQSEQNVMQQIH